MQMDKDIYKDISENIENIFSREFIGLSAITTSNAEPPKTLTLDMMRKHYQLIRSNSFYVDEDQN